MDKKTSEWEKELSEITFKVDCSVAEGKLVTEELKQFIQDLLAKEKMELVERIERELDFAEMDKEMADDPADPKVRINYFRHILEALKSELQEEVGGE